MAERSLIYAAVARGTTVLAEHSDFTGNFAGIARQCLEKLPSSSNRFVYTCDGHNFSYLVADGYAYFVVASQSVSREITTACLERIKEDFIKRYGGGKAATATASSLDRDFGPKLKGHMKYCMEHTQEISRLAKVQAQVSEVKEVMMQNIDKVIDRGAKIDVLVDKTENLRSEAETFKVTGGQVKKKMWLQNMKVKLIVLAILLVLILIIVLSICKSAGCF